MDTVTEPKYLSLAVAAKKLIVSRETVWRWGTKGLSVAGAVVKLRLVRVGRYFRTTQEWIDAFVAACNPTAESAAVPVPTGRATTLNEAEEDAREARLRDRLGF
jgi:hypothetical protein